MSENNNFIPEQKPYVALTPFHLFIKNNFPFIEDTFEALDNYGLYCKLVEYLNRVIANENVVSDNTRALYNAFVELNNYVSNYFDNLDVQEEINNKLDDMVEAGTLQEIIAEYLQATALWCFDTVADMKLATNLINGSYAKTLGFYEKNDNGGAVYKIRKITNDDVIDEMIIIEINDEQNELIAELIKENTMSTKQFGIVADGTTDQTTKINKAIEYCNNLIIEENTTYTLSNIVITSDKYVYDTSKSGYINIMTNGNENGAVNELVYKAPYHPAIVLDSDTTIDSDYILPAQDTYGGSLNFRKNGATKWQIYHDVTNNDKLMFECLIDTFNLPLMMYKNQVRFGYRYGHLNDLPLAAQEFIGNQAFGNNTELAQIFRLYVQATQELLKYWRTDYTENYITTGDNTRPNCLKISKNGNGIFFGGVSGYYYTSSGIQDLDTTYMEPGTMVFDITLGKPVFLKSKSPVTWVDATGATLYV